MAGLPERIVKLEKAVMESESRLAQIHRELRAVAITKEIFENFIKDSDDMLEELSQEISCAFSALTEKERHVILKNYSAENAGITDSGGGEREKDLLSAGTRDAFLLAARLVLACKSQDLGKKAVIVLDEPFLTLDRPRITRALSVLKDFHQKYGWQIIIFTKDESMEDQARAVFDKKLLTHKLS